jgi:hypothetical protein
MGTMRIEALAAAAVIAAIQGASAADLSLKPKYPHEQASDQRLQRDVPRESLGPAPKEILFEQFIRWLMFR